MKYLLSIAIGPVQDFISAARRTSDLDSGSGILSDISKQVADHLGITGKLIFPATPGLHSPNKILAIVEGEPKTIAAEAETKAKAALKTLWNDLPSIPDIKTDIADDQLAHFLEFYAAWVALDDDEGNYATARTQVERLMAGRKALRDFKQPKSQTGIPKSPLDPARDCVLPVVGMGIDESKCCTEKLKPLLWLKKSETLDAVSLLKRHKGVSKRQSVPSTSEMAARPFLALIRSKAGAEWAQLERLVGNKAGLTAPEALFPGRAEEEFPENSTEILEIADLRKRLLACIGKKDLPPYYAILSADGDHVGAFLNNLKTPQEHIDFSEVLDQFAVSVQGIVTACEGFLVYSGGDDVLALLPVNTAMQCARQINGAFAGLMGRWREKDPPTLSAGIAIVHHLTPLSISLNNARDAERTAKTEGRDSLCVALHKRGGPPVKSTLKWTMADNAGNEGWDYWIEAFNQGGISRGLPYELRDLALETMGTGVTEIAAEANRIIARKKDAARSSGAPVRTVPASVQGADSLLSLSHRLIIARFLSDYPGVI